MLKKQPNEDKFKKDFCVALWHTEPSLVCAGLVRWVIGLYPQRGIFWACVARCTGPVWWSTGPHT